MNEIIPGKVLIGISALMMMTVGCEGEGLRKIGAFCVEENDCESGLCYESLCLNPDEDYDHDGIKNGVEKNITRTDYGLIDSDGDGVDDGTEVGTDQMAPLDTDGDGIIDALESALPSADPDHDCVSDQYDPENDVYNDGMAMVVELHCVKVGVCGEHQEEVTAFCTEGVPVCDYTAVSGYEPLEVACDGKDNDCDGETDEDCESECVPACGTAVCGLDPICGTQSCGTCEEGTACESGICIEDACVPACGAAVCGLDPVCGTQSCGTCEEGTTCESGVCVEDACVPACGAALCGLDPVCGTLSCGTCEDGFDCQSGECAQKECEPACEPGYGCKLGECVETGEMVLIPAGSFWMGCNVAVDTQCLTEVESPYHQVTLSAYYMDKTEVTVAAYGECVTAGACTVPYADSSDYNWNVAGKEDHPMNWMDWNRSKAYCEWAGKRLPTEAEWEKAARGTDGRKYPWGNQTATCTYAVMDEGGYGCGTDSTASVCSKSPAGDSPYGLCDMSGNVWEWVSDWYGWDYYSSSPGTNPGGPASGSYRVFRNGGFGVDADLRASRRNARDPSYYNHDSGWRCARP